MMQRAEEIATQYFESISGYELNDKEKFFSNLTFFDELDYSKTNLNYAIYNISTEDLTPIDDKKTKVVYWFLSLTLKYLQAKTDYKDRKKIDTIIKQATKKANDVLFDAISKLKQIKEDDEYFKLKDKDLNALISQITILLDNPINEKLHKPNKKDIQEFLNRLKNKSLARSAKRLLDSIN